MRHGARSSVGLALPDSVQIHQTALSAMAEQAFAFARVIRNILRQPLADDETHQRFGSVVDHLVRNMIDRMPHEIARADFVRLIADHRRTAPGQHVDALFLVVMKMIFGGAMAGLYGDQVHADILQPRSIAQ